MLTNMFLGTAHAAHDGILDFSTAMIGNLFFAPGVDLLEDPPHAGAPPASAAEPAPGSGDGSLGIASLRYVAGP